jgi:hypothetical protein
VGIDRAELRSDAPKVASEFHKAGRQKAGFILTFLRNSIYATAGMHRQDDSCDFVVRVVDGLSA